MLGSDVLLGELTESSVAGRRSVLKCELKNGLVGGIFRQDFTQERDFMLQFLEQVAQAVRHIVVE
jgi:hypothetical protein